MCHEKTFIGQENGVLKSMPSLDKQCISVLALVWVLFLVFFYLHHTLCFQNIENLQSAKCIVSHDFVLVCHHDNSVPDTFSLVQF